jgi:trimeric autotransporter adhesin
MKRKFYFKGFLLLFALLLTVSGFSQNAGISAGGATPPNAAAGLDVNFTTKGLLIPRVTLVSTTSFSPLSAHVAGMVVYNTATAGDVTPGLYFNNGTAWVRTVLKDGSASGDMQYWNASTQTWVNIPVGTPGQKLTLTAGGIPAWQ